MATPGYGQQQYDMVTALKAEVKGVVIPKLKDVLRQEKLLVSGNKTVLQNRLISHIDFAHKTGNVPQLEAIRNTLRGTPTRSTNGFASNSYSSPYSNHTPTSSLSPQQYTPNMKIGPGTTFGMPPTRPPFNSRNVTFTNSPFYKILRPLTDTVECKVRETTRDTARLTVQLSPDVADQIQRDSNIRVMVFCAADSHTLPYRPSEISFPHQVELKCNEQEVKANLRGLKNKPGSTRPVDITSLLKKKIPNHPNIVEMVYALTTKATATEQKFYVMVNLVIKKPVEDLVNELKRGKYLSKERVLTEMRSKASDPDIVATSSVMSLKCPLSFIRIQTPCRGTGCSHNQCFDATSYLQLQEQAPTWTCPVCNKPAAWDGLVLDYYFNDILQNTSESTEQVTIEPDGSWHKQNQQSETPNGVARQQSRPSNPTPSDDEGDDDLIEIKDASIPMKHLGFPQTITPTPSSIRTPPINSRPSSSTPNATASTSRKRPRDVIDLTLSDDDTPAPVVKRPSMSSANGNSFRSRLPEHISQPQQQTSNQRYQFQMPSFEPSPGFDFLSRNGSGAGF